MLTGQDSLFELIPNVRKLDIRRWEVRPGSFDFDFTPLAQLQDLHIARLDLTIHPRLPPSLQSLNMVGCCMVNWAAPATQANMKECPLPELTTLSFGKRYNIRVDELYLILDANLGNLKHLDIRACALSAQDINKLIEFGYLSDIVDLELPEAVDDGIAKALAKNLHFLKTLTIGASRKITGVGVKALVMKSHSKLEYLNIDHCMSVGIDAVDFARSQGITVRFAFPDRTGKRVWTA
ncbi:hypothetical protein MMC12_000535 [Toensbergia leucococca]|nr:hypothetical protein [Toensbergia leucococca]